MIRMGWNIGAAMQLLEASICQRVYPQNLHVCLPVYGMNVH